MGGETEVEPITLQMGGVREKSGRLRFLSRILTSKPMLLTHFLASLQNGRSTGMVGKGFDTLTRLDLNYKDCRVLLYGCYG